MTEKQIKQIKVQLPEGERFNRAYSAFEGGIRVVSRDSRDNEYRYEVHFDADDNVTITRK